MTHLVIFFTFIVQSEKTSTNCCQTGAKYSLTKFMTRRGFFSSTGFVIITPFSCLRIYN